MPRLRRSTYSMSWYHFDMENTLQIRCANRFIIALVLPDVAAEKRNPYLSFRSPHAKG